MVRADIAVRVWRGTHEDAVAAALADVIALEVLAGRRDAAPGGPGLDGGIAEKRAVAGGMDEGAALLADLGVPRGAGGDGGQLRDGPRDAERGCRPDDRTARRSCRNL